MDKKGRIELQIYSGWQKRANMNTNTNIWTGICKDKYQHKYSSQTALDSQGHYRVCLDVLLSVRAGKKKL